MNDKNIDFYRKIQVAKFKEIAALLGFDSGIDIDLLMPYIKDAKTIAELGTGYGRVVLSLIENDFKGKIIAVERSPELIDYLQHELPESILLLQQDYKKIELPEKVDVVLWLWSGILELSKEEQSEVVRHVAEHLTPKGILVVEIPRQVKFVGKLTDSQHITVETEWGMLEAYLPTFEEIRNYAAAAGFKNIEIIDYQTTVQLNRSFYLLRK